MVKESVAYIFSCSSGMVAHLWRRTTVRTMRKKNIKMAKDMFYCSVCCIPNIFIFFNGKEWDEAFQRLRNTQNFVQKVVTSIGWLFLSQVVNIVLLRKSLCTFIMFIKKNTLKLANNNEKLFSTRRTTIIELNT